jgi:putative oxidoreductase
MESVNNTFLLVGRLLMASLFLSTGIPHALDYGSGLAKYIAALGGPYPEILAVIATAVEVLGAIALILGVLPRITALALVAFVIVAAGLAHRYWQYPAAQQSMQMAHFFKNTALIGGLLFYYVSGPGAWSLAGRSAGAGAGVPARA